MFNDIQNSQHHPSLGIEIYTVEDASIRADVNQQLTDCFSHQRDKENGMFHHKCFVNFLRHSICRFLENVE